MRPTPWHRLESSLAAAEEAFLQEYIVGEKARVIHEKLRVLLADVTTERIRAEHVEQLCPTANELKR
jgi:hypothetical protein